MHFGRNTIGARKAFKVELYSTCSYGICRMTRTTFVTERYTMYGYFDNKLINITYLHIFVFVSDIMNNAQIGVCLLIAQIV